MSSSPENGFYHGMTNFLPFDKKIHKIWQNTQGYTGIYTTSLSLFVPLQLSH